MIKTETIVINGNEYLRTYSTTGKYIERDGIKYSEAIDLPNVNYIYTESSESCLSEEEEKTTAYNILMGVDA